MRGASCASLSSMHHHATKYGHFAPPRMTVLLLTTLMWALRVTAMSEMQPLAMRSCGKREPYLAARGSIFRLPSQQWRLPLSLALFGSQRPLCWTAGLRLRYVHPVFPGRFTRTTRAVLILSRTDISMILVSKWMSCSTSWTITRVTAGILLYVCLPKMAVDMLRTYWAVRNIVRSWSCLVWRATSQSDGGEFYNRERANFCILESRKKKNYASTRIEPGMAYLNGAKARRLGHITTFAGEHAIVLSKKLMHEI